jgi:RNA polymerase sigma-70 factor (ECF subfamily)
MDEQNLVLGLRDQDPSVVQEWLSRDGDRLLRSAFLLCGNEPDAQDLAQETFLQALRSVQRFHGRSSLYTWLRGILLNLSRHYHRERKRMVFDDGLVEQTLPVVTESPMAMDERLASSALSRALGQLSAPHREVLILRFYEDLKIHEIAERLGVSCGTVKSRLHYALQRMQQLMPNEMNLFGARGTERTERA